MARVTMSQVARAAEVSVATVSHAINGTGTLPEATRERVRSVAEALGYVPFFGKGNGRPRTVAVACTTYGPDDWPFTSVPYFAQAIMAVAGVAHAAGYALTVLPPTFPGDLWRSLDVDGVLLMDSPQDDPAAAVLRRRGVPVVFDGVPDPPRHRDVWVDNPRCLHLCPGRDVNSPHVLLRSGTFLTPRPDSAIPQGTQTITEAGLADDRGMCQTNQLPQLHNHPGQGKLQEHAPCNSDRQSLIGRLPVLGADPHALTTRTGANMVIFTGALGEHYIPPNFERSARPSAERAPTREVGDARSAAEEDVCGISERS